MNLAINPLIRRSGVPNYARNVGRACNTNHMYKWNLHLICGFFHIFVWFRFVTGSIQFEVIPIPEPGPKVAC